LDVLTEASLRAALDAETDGATTVIVAQRIATIKHADQIIVLDAGSITGIGTHDELLATCAAYREMAASQLGEDIAV
jgi:ATP-binding cassette subfamily B multidrug efflux pump